jgi:hypothetical protein
VEYLGFYYEFSSDFVFLFYFLRPVLNSWTRNELKQIWDICLISFVQVTHELDIWFSQIRKHLRHVYYPWIETLSYNLLNLTNNLLLLLFFTIASHFYIQGCTPLNYDIVHHSSAHHSVELDRLSSAYEQEFSFLLVSTKD